MSSWQRQSDSVTYLRKKPQQTICGFLVKNGLAKSYILFKVDKMLHPLCAQVAGVVESVKNWVHKSLIGSKIKGAQNFTFTYLRLKRWVRRCAPLRKCVPLHIRLHRPWIAIRKKTEAFFVTLKLDGNHIHR